MKLVVGISFLDRVLRGIFRIAQQMAVRRTCDARIVRRTNLV